MVRLCSLLRAIIMRINSVQSRRKYFSKVYGYLLRLYKKMESIDIVEVNGSIYIVVKLGGYSSSNYCIASNGRVYKIKKIKNNIKLEELDEVKELEAMKEIEEYILNKAKNLANRLGLNTEKILNPPKKTRQKRTPPQKKPKTKKANQ